MSFRDDVGNDDGSATGEAAWSLWEGNRRLNPSARARFRPKEVPENAGFLGNGLCSIARVATCKGCILIVDDDPDVRHALAACFEDLGCTVVAAADGVQGVECLGDSLKPCLVLLDLNMPRLGGAELAAYIRAHRHHGGLPIISMSAGPDRLSPPLVECHRCKPFDFDGLMPLIAKFCQDRDWLGGAR